MTATVASVPELQTETPVETEAPVRALMLEAIDLGAVLGGDLQTQDLPAQPDAETEADVVLRGPRHAVNPRRVSHRTSRDVQPIRQPTAGHERGDPASAVVGARRTQRRPEDEMILRPAPGEEAAVQVHPITGAQ